MSWFGKRLTDATVQAVAQQTLDFGNMRIVPERWYHRLMDRFFGGSEMRIGSVSIGVDIVLGRGGKVRPKIGIGMVESRDVQK